RTSAHRPMFRAWSDIAAICSTRSATEGSPARQAGRTGCEKSAAFIFRRRSAEAGDPLVWDMAQPESSRRPVRSTSSYSPFQWDLKWASSFGMVVPGKPAVSTYSPPSLWVSTSLEMVRQVSQADVEARSASSSARFRIARLEVPNRARVVICSRADMSGSIRVRRGPLGIRHPDRDGPAVERGSVHRLEGGPRLDPVAHHDEPVAS